MHQFIVQFLISMSITQYYIKKRHDIIGRSHFEFPSNDHFSQRTINYEKVK